MVGNFLEGLECHLANEVVLCYKDTQMKPYDITKVTDETEKRQCTVKK